MDKILFVVPPHLQISDFLEPTYNARVMTRDSGEKFGAVLTDMPLGPLSMSAYLKLNFDKKIDIKVLDFNVELNHLKNWLWTRDSFIEYFQYIFEHGVDRVTGISWMDYSPTIIGTSILFGPSYDNVLDILKVSKNIFPNSLLLAGGGIATTTYGQMFDDSPELDAIGFTECEIPFVELIKAEDKLHHIKNDRSWISRGEKNLPRSSFEAKYIWNLDEIPFYDYAIVNKDDYSLNPALTAYAGVYDSSNNFHYMTSRGCPYRCNFCASHKVNGREMRYHSIERVESDLRLLKEKHGAKTIVIQDDNFMGQGEEGRQRALDIVNIIGKLKLTVVFQNSLTLVAVKRDLLEAMKNAGVTQLLLSVESGSAKSLKRMHKPLRLEDIERVAKDCRELGIYTDCNILIGNIFETEEDVEESAAFLRSGRCPADWFKIFITTPLPGSELHEQAIELGLINEKVINLDFKKANIDRPELPAKRLEFLQYKMNLELNFIRNTNYYLGERLFESQGIEAAKYNYGLALQGFLSAIKAKDNHLFGHYFTSIIYHRLGDEPKALHHEALAMQASNDEFWKTWLEVFPEFSKMISDIKIPHSHAMI